MDSLIFEYLVCFLAVFGVTTLLFLLWLARRSAHEGLGYVSETTRKAGNKTSQFVVGSARHALESGRSAVLGGGERVPLSLSSENSPRRFTGADRLGR